jgi:hypothetical protein
MSVSVIAGRNSHLYQQLNPMRGSERMTGRKRAHGEKAVNEYSVVMRAGALC